MHHTIPVSEIMITDVVTASSEATVADAAALLRDESVSSVVVVRDGRPTGIVTTGDLATCLCDHHDLEGLELGDVMSRPLETITADASIVDAAERVRTTGFEHLPAVGSDGSLVGILTTVELSSFIPSLVDLDAEPGGKPPQRRVRTDTQYERDDWTVEYHGRDDATVSVGDGVTFSKSISAEDVAAVAGATGDTNRLHLDPAYAAETRFGEPILHGILTTGVISAAIARLPGVPIYLSQESTFLRPVPVGDRVTATCRVMADLGHSTYRIETVVRDASDERVLEGTAVVLVDDQPSTSTARF